MSAPHAPGLYSEGFFRDPFAYYALLRESDPVSWDDEHEMWVITRYADVSAVIRRPEIFSAELSARDQRPVTPPVRSQDAASLDAVTRYRLHEFIQADPPRHGPTRAHVSARFSPRRMESVRPMVRRIVGELLDALEGRPSWDVLDAVARPLPLQVINELMGVEPDEREAIADQARRRMASVLSLDDDRMQRSAQGFAETAGFIDRAIDERIGAASGAAGCPLRDDVLDDIAKAETSGAWSRLESQANAMMIIDAGHETTVQLVCNATLALLRHPEQWELLCSDPQRLAASATEECLRFEPPLHAFRRVVSADVEFGGRSMAAGDRVLGVVAAANRDPRQFVDPEKFDITRTPNSHLAFGAGAHYCLGQYLARMEGQEYLLALARRFPDLRLVSSDVEYFETPRVRSMTGLPVLTG